MESDESRDASSDGDFASKGPRSPSASPSASRGSQSSPDRASSSSRNSVASPIEPPSNNPSSPPPPLNGGSASDFPKSPLSPHSLQDENSRDSAKSDDRAQSRSSSKSKSPVSPDRVSRSSFKSRASSNDDEEIRPKSPLADDDGNSTDSSDSSRRSSSRKNVSKRLDSQAEAISDGEMESDEGKASDTEEPPQKTEAEAPANVIVTDLAHQDLSDVSDLESIGGQSEEEEEEDASTAREDSRKPTIDLRQKIEDAKSKKVLEKQQQINVLMDKSNRAPEETEEQLDFEAEDGECADDAPAPSAAKESAAAEAGELPESQDEKGAEPEELEEGELTDEDEVRPEETEPRPVCRFFSRGQCTWGASCRFLHPGVTDKGNYTMFEMIRPVVGVEYRNFPASRLEAPPMESAWERALRSAKEMVKKSIKRKEQDMDFEEKKMNLTLAQAEFDKENGYYTAAARVPSPEPTRFVTMRHAPEFPPPHVVRPPQEEYYGRRQVIYDPPEFAPVPREKPRSYRELPPHRMPDYYNNKYEEEMAAAPQGAVAAAPKPRHSKPKREVIVQRVETRADEWADPWMRSKSPGGRKGPRKASYSSGSSYSSSSSSRSSSGSSRTSYRSGSRSPQRRRPPAAVGRLVCAPPISPSVIVSERKAASERAALMNPPAPRKRAPSPGAMRAGAQNPPAPTSKVDQFGRTRQKLAVAAALARVKGRHRSSKSSSGSSSGSSSSDSDSSGSSSSSSREGSPRTRRSGVDLKAALLKAQAIDALKGGAEKRQIKLNLKNPVTAAAAARKADISELVRKAEASQQGKKRAAAASPVGGEPPAKTSAGLKKSTSRREELLKQLKAVEDAIAKKRSKVN